MIIKNGTVIDPAGNMVQKADLWLKDGKIMAIASPGTLGEDGEEVIDASGLIVAPGLVDTHVHFRDPGNTEKETLHTGALAAAAGGFTTVICMANVSPKMDSVSRLKEVQARAEKEKIRICQAANVTMDMAGRELVPMEELAAAGAAGFTDDGKPILDGRLAFEAMKKAAALGQPISLHEEDPAFIAQNGINRGKASEYFGIDGSPAMAEDVLVARDCMLALHSGADVVIQHISSGNSIALVRNAKALGAHIHAEATPHHFTLTEEAVIRHGSMAKMNPPLRTEADRLAIIEGLKDGTVDLIATDHAPHTDSQKAVSPMWEAPSGIIGLETSLALGITSLVKPGHLTLVELLRKMTVNPADLYHLDAGRIQEGRPADLVIFDENEDWIPRTYHSKSTNTPFTGCQLTGRVKYTICRGEVVYQLR